MKNNRVCQGLNLLWTRYTPVRGTHISESRLNLVDQVGRVSELDIVKMIENY